jgi:hypothetical protein
VQPYYTDAAVTIYHGDCRDVLPTLGMVDHVITDPPFTQRTSEKSRGCRDGSFVFTGDENRRRIDFDGIDGREGELAASFLQSALRWVIVFCAVEQIGAYADASADCWVRGTVWHRTNSAPQFTGDRPGQACEGIAIMHRKGRKRWNRGGSSLLYVGPTINSCGDPDRGTAHPTVKPQWLMASIVLDFTDASETVLDPFAGSGTTLLAAKRLGRKAIGIELNEKYCEVAANRLRQSVLALEYPPAATQADLWPAGDGDAA